MATKQNAPEKSINENLKDSSTRFEAELLMAHAAGMTREELLLRGDETPSQKVLDTYFKYVDRWKAGEPVARISGVKEFWSLDFKLNEETLVPRPDSESLIEVALKVIGPDERIQVLDLGTGTGCLLLSLLSERPKAKGVGIDLSEKAINCARENAINLGLASQAVFQEGDWVSDRLPNGPFDIILSNPPYIETKTINTLAPEVATYDPRAALDGGEDGLVHYRAIIPRAYSLLNKGGRLVLEIGEGQRNFVSDLLIENGFGDISIQNDLAGIERVISGLKPVENSIKTV